MCETIFPRGRGGLGRRSFQDDSSALPSLCALFPLLLHQLYLRLSGIRSQMLETPESCSDWRGSDEGLIKPHTCFTLRNAVCLGKLLFSHPSPLHSKKEYYRDNVVISRSSLFPTCAGRERRLKQKRLSIFLTVKF